MLNSMLYGSRKFVLAGSIGIAFATLAAPNATPSAAQTTIPNTSIAALHLATPVAQTSRDSKFALAASNCNPGSAVISVTGPNGCVYFFTPGTQTNLGGEHPFVEMSGSVFNRVWFHQNSDGSGWADCKQAHDVSVSITGRDQDADNIQMSSNTSPCP